jgi:hypothetical protein
MSRGVDELPGGGEGTGGGGDEKEVAKERARGSEVKGIQCRRCQLRLCCRIFYSTPYPSCNLAWTVCTEKGKTQRYE